MTLEEAIREKEDQYNTSFFEADYWLKSKYLREPLLTEARLFVSTGEIAHILLYRGGLLFIDERDLFGNNKLGAAIGMAILDLKTIIEQS